MLRCSKRVRTVYHFVNRVTFQIEDHLCRYRNHNRIRSWNRLSFIMGITVPMGRIIYIEKSFVSLPWRRNGRDSVSNHQPHDCLLNRLFRRRSKKTSKLRVTGLCAGIHRGPVNSPHKWPVTRKMFPFDDVIMEMQYCTLKTHWQLTWRLHSCKWWPSWKVFHVWMGNIQASPQGPICHRLRCS